MNLPIETLDLEALRQRIEAAENEAGSLSDYLDRGQSGPSPVADPVRRIVELEGLIKALKQQLSALVAERPAAVAAWADLHIEALTQIAGEPPCDAIAQTRKYVARQTIEAWQSVRAGNQTYVNTNWYYLAGHQKAMRRLLP